MSKEQTKEPSSSVSSLALHAHQCFTQQSNLCRGGELYAQASEVPKRCEEERGQDPCPETGGEIGAESGWPEAQSARACRNETS
jgi:hypothetical protein